MNQILKDVIYGKGTQKQIDFIAELGGMNEEERQMLQLFHKGHSDIYIQEEMHLDKKSFSRIEESVRAKTAIAVIHCIFGYMEQCEL